MLQAVSIVGNFAAGLLARAIGYRRAIAAGSLGLGLSMIGSFAVLRGHEALVYGWLPLVGFFSADFGLFAPVGDFRAALVYAGALGLPAALFAFLAPEPAAGLKREG